MGTVDDYLHGINEPQRTALERIRRIIKEKAPDAEEVISYGMPGFKYIGQYLLGYAAFKDHMSFFPTGGPIEKLTAKLGNYKLSKGTIQFTMDNQLPEGLISELLTVRINAIKMK